MEYFNERPVGHFHTIFVKYIRACGGSFFFWDQYVGPYAFSVSGSPGLLTVAQDIIGAINEAFGASGMSLKTRLIVTGPIAVATNFSTNGSGPNYSHQGDNTLLGASSPIFEATHRIRILLNGVEKDKQTEITWVNSTTFTLATLACNAGDILTIYN